MSCEDGSLKVGETSFPCIIKQGGSELPVDIDINTKQEKIILPTIGRRAIRTGPMPENLTPDSIAPSRLVATEYIEAHTDLMVERYGDGLDIEIGLTGAVLGTFLHRCFEVLGANPGASNRLLTITGIVIGEDAVKTITINVTCFEDWLNQRFSIRSFDRELPLLTLNENGSVIYGTADLVIHTTDGVWIIDHKSDQIDDVKSAFHFYKPQLESYVNALATRGNKVLGVGINWIRRSEVVLEQF